VDAVVEVGDKAGNGLLEVDVVLPKRVVSVNEQGLFGGSREQLVRSLIEGVHVLIIRRLERPRLPRWSLRCPTWGMSGLGRVCQIGSNG
jgi:hypothetical protein